MNLYILDGGTNFFMVSAVSKKEARKKVFQEGKGIKVLKGVQKVSSLGHYKVRLEKK